MSPKFCSVKNCNRFRGDKRNISYFRLPVDECSRKIWHDFISRNNASITKKWKLSKESLLCSRHFKNCCIQKHLKLRPEVRRGHYPSVFVNLNGTTLTHDHHSAPLSKVGNCQENPMEHIDENSDEPFEQIDELLDEPMEQNDENSDEENHESSVKSLLQPDDAKMFDIIAKQRQEIQDLKKANTKLRREIEKLNRHLTEMKRQKILIQHVRQPSEHAHSSVIEQLRSRKKGDPVGKELKQFSVALHYYSSRAYDYVRRTFELRLPHPSCFPKWTSGIETKPGFLPCALRFLSSRNVESTCKILYSISFDEIHIKKQIRYKDGRLTGFVDYGDISEPKQSKIETLATTALFIYATEINGDKKIPVGYALTDGCSASLMKSAITRTLETLHSAQATVINITFDGLKANFAAAKSMGANFDVASSNFAPTLKHPKTNETVHFTPDACHMMKLARNALSDFKVFKDKNGNEIRWEFVQKLAKLQSDEGLKLGNKLSVRHTDYQKQKMKVGLAVQLMSNSVGVALRTCKKLGIPGFELAEATALFFENMNRLFDILNSFSKGEGFKSPLSKDNFRYHASFLRSMKSYILDLKTDSGVELYKSSRPTFVIGLFITIDAVEGIMADYVLCQNPTLKYLPTYKLSQDPLELFFSALRQRFGRNDNPDTIQLEFALRRMLTVRIDPSMSANCRPLEANAKTLICPLAPSEVQSTAERELFIDFPDFVTLSSYVRNVTVYIAGFVGRAVQKKSDCRLCSLALENDDPETCAVRSDYTFIYEKNNGGLFIPSDDLVKVCQVTEQVIRCLSQVGLTKLNEKLILKKGLRELCQSTIFSDLRISYEDDHAPLSNHVISLLEKIIRSYVKVRLHHIAKENTLARIPTTVRNQLTKLVTFSGN